MDISSFPMDIWNVIIEQLVIIIGIKNAVLLRRTSTSFNAAIMNAICITQVVDIRDPCTPCMGLEMNPSLRGKIALVKSRSNTDATLDLLVVIDSVNRRLDMLTGDMDEISREKRHLAVAETVSSANRTNYSMKKAYDAKWDAQNLFCGAVTIGDLRLVKSLMKERQTSQPSTDADNDTPYFSRPIVIAAGLGYLDIVRYLLKKGAREYIMSPCHGQGVFEAKLASHGLSSRLQFKLVGGLNNYDPVSVLSPLEAAIYGKHKHVVRELLLPEYRKSCSKVENLLCLIAAATADVEIVNMLLNAEEMVKLSDIRPLGQEMLWEAIKHDRNEIAQVLFDEGCVHFTARAASPTRSALDPFQWAAYLGRIDMMIFLIGQGVSTERNEYGRRGYSPVEVAAMSGQEEAVGLLLDRDADPLLALWSATEHSQPRITKLLLDRFPNILNWDGGHVGRSALWNAVTAKNLRNITLLVEHGVSLNDGYKAQKRPINVAKDGRGQWVVNHLLSLGAHDTREEVRKEQWSLTGLVLIEERTWQWISKY
ncbi:hypothetical protein E4U24_004802 [Claviceps purpurea]|nr:hypothetical protein E4U51_001618 [Claviceps purpurea]KAG6219907.1 hypothetical protein E4U34_003295 [Claviceps purpurea]KAG6229601.1 hypothetical protein E4U26_000107 [Claviceps purpurea]KAG6244834.1 hypothetical protein E4U24_004802 [Claviceps purpurea]